MTRTKKVSSALDLQQKVLPMTKKALEALEEAAQEMDEVVTWICDEAITLGINPTQLNWVNAQSYVHGKVQDYVELEDKVKELGYTSLPIAIKALAQIKAGVQGIEILPEEFHSVPQIWRRGRAKTSISEGFAPLTLRSAQREHTQVVQLLLEAWPLADEGDRDAMLIAYLSESAESFKQQVYDFLYRTDSPLEEQLLTEIKERETMEKWQDWGRSNENARAKASFKRRRKAQGK